MCHFSLGVPIHGHFFRNIVDIKDFILAAGLVTDEIRWLCQAAVSCLIYYTHLLFLTAVCAILGLVVDPATFGLNPVIFYAAAAVVVFFNGFFFLPRRAIEICRVLELLHLWSQIQNNTDSPTIEKILNQFFEVINLTWKPNGTKQAK